MKVKKNFQIKIISQVKDFKTGRKIMLKIQAVIEKNEFVAPGQDPWSDGAEMIIVEKKVFPSFHGENVKKITEADLKNGFGFKKRVSSQMSLSEDWKTIYFDNGFKGIWESDSKSGVGDGIYTEKEFASFEEAVNWFKF